MDAVVPTSNGGIDDVPGGGAKFTDDRWNAVRQYPAQQHRELCDPCLTEHHEQSQAERAAQRQAEEAAAREAAEAEAKKNRGLFGRRR